jgi:cell division protease FtsH
MARSPSDSAATPTPEASPTAPKRVTPGRTVRPRPWWLIFLVLLLGNYAISQLFFQEPDAITIPYTFFKQQVAAGNVADVTSVGESIEGAFKARTSYPPVGAKPPAANAPQPRASMQFRTQRPAFADQDLEKVLDDNGVVIKAVDENASSWFKLLVGFGPTLLLIGAFVWLSRRAAAAAGASGGGLFSLGRSRAKRYSEEGPKVTFDDVAGIDEAENELIEIVDFLKNPAKYQRLGGMVPKGVLLVGAPGTGKTLLARAIAGQAGVPFFSLSASEFIEMIVGVGASRVRDLFKQAREAAPAIIFIDELDAIGRTRGSGAQLGGHDEREQTLNQILTEMDGFDSREGVIVLAATNRADILDQALLRPGRFDRRVVVQRPDRAGRAAILAVHTKKVPLGPDVSLERIAAETPGLVGAELRNLVNEAALLAARKDGSTVNAPDFAEALQKITLGPARNILLNPADRERTAYHEAGHALLALLMPGSDPVHRVSIVPRGMALGATWQLPIDDRTSYAEDYLQTRITCALGGRAAERLVYGVATTGAESDLQQVTEIARRMVLRWGMSEKLGPISFVAPQDDGLPPAFQHQPYSEATSELIDAEVRRIVEESHLEADRMLAAHRPKLDALAQALLKAESLDATEIAQVMALPEHPAEAPEVPAFALMSRR